MKTAADYAKQLISPEEQALYDHLVGCAGVESPAELLARFQALFIDGTGYGNREIAAVLDQIVASQDVDAYFHHIFNRCCHILINRWQTSRHTHSAIAELVSLIEVGPSLQVREVSRMRSARRLREVVGNFTQTEQYLMLKRLVQVLNAPAHLPADHPTRPLGVLIGRYPYLYEHCLLGEESPQAHQLHVRRIQAEAQRRLELDLSHYVNYRVRKSRLRRQGALDSHGHRLRPINNPTLLTDRELVSSLQQFSSKAGTRRTYSDVAQSFLSQSCQGTTFKSFKDNLYSYITDSIDSGYGNRRFNNQLHQQLSMLYPDSGQHGLNDFLLVRTCSQLFNFLIIDTSPSRQHFVFIDLINNLGPLATTSILLKILLLCRKVKPYLERRFAVLFSNYEASTQGTVAWLVKVLENLNVALSLNFGTLDLSHVLT